MKFQVIDNLKNLPTKPHETIKKSEQLPNFSDKYKEYCRPKLGELLESLKLDKSYHRALGNYLYYKSTDENSNETPVLDFVSGYGTSLLGHNHPELIQELLNSIYTELPFSTQGAIRPYTSLLAEKLNDLLSVPDNSRYFSNLTNSGTEAVEAAIKHAYLVWLDNIERRTTKIKCAVNDFFNEKRDKDIYSDNDEISQLEKDITKFNTRQLRNFSKKAVICALKGSFHGKTTSSVKVTYNKTFRRSFEDLTTFKTEFIDINTPSELKKIYKKNTFKLLYPVEEANKIIVKEQEFNRVFAFIMETILGEGGVIQVPDSSLSILADLHEELKIPFIIDEIQTGCGRTGSFFSYTKTPLNNIVPEYITLSKALGGSITKIGAVLINEKVYDPEFGLIHTSTFSEDDFSSKVALKVIEILTRNNNALMESIDDMGAYFLQKLEKLKAKYPNIIKEVRGKGLMLALEFTSLDHLGPFFNYAGKQGFIALLVASYILEHHNIRLMSPLSTMFKGEIKERRKSVIRIQPPAYIKEAEIEKLINALDETLNIIDKNNEFILVAHLINYDLKLLERIRPKSIDVKNNFNEHIDADVKLGFIVHITELDYLINHYLTSFNSYQYNRRALIKWWTKLSRFLEPDLMHKTYLSIQDKTVEVNIISLPYLPKYMIRTMAEGKDKKNYNRLNELKLYEIQDKIQDASDYASVVGNKDLPVQIVGLGAYNSIVTENALSFNDLARPVTTGNAYTAALMYQGIIKAMQQRNSELDKSTIAVVGAGGNIGSAIAELFCTKVHKTILVGRDNNESRKKAERVVQQCKELIQLSSEEEQSDKQVVVGSIFNLMEADIVVVATNSSDMNLVTPHNVKPGSVVCCASVPSNLSQSFKDHTNDFFVFDSGYAKLPGNNQIDLIGMPKDGLIYGCLGETILLALDKTGQSFMKGDVTREKIEATIKLAEKYGFELGKFILGDHIKRMIS